ncbi:MAG: hypothetical protein IVW57_03700, partial [Ktedonobacterales bacterium]|nr:hypothetical protein [Ktedonobacterales bacterium]
MDLPRRPPASDEKEGREQEASAPLTSLPLARGEESRGERLQKYLARAGVTSRRHAEELIAAGMVSVNGAVVREPGTRVEAGADEVRVRGRVVRPPETAPLY